MPTRNLKRLATAMLTAASLFLTTLPALAASGTFKGINNHTVSGAVSVEKRGDEYVIVLGTDFDFDGAPDPRIAFGNDGKYAKGTDFKLLKADKGAQEYVVPKEIDPSKFNEVHIWCRKFTVGLAIAKLK